MRNTSNRGAEAGSAEITRFDTAFPHWMRRLGYYGLALLLVAAAAMLRRALPGVLGPTPFLVFYTAWVGAALLGGLGPGLFATVASWLCVELFFDFTPGVSIIGSPTEPARLVVALVGGLTVSLLAEMVRRGRVRERRQMNRLAEQTAQVRTANEQLRASEEKYRALVENSLVGIGISKGERIVYANQSLLRMYGYDTLEEFAAQSLPDHLTPRSRAILEEWGKRYRRGEEMPTILEHDIVRKDGAIRTLQLSVSFLSGADGIYAHTAFVDITDRKQAEETLRESEERFRSLIEAAPEAIFVQSQGRFLYLNPSAIRLFDAEGPEELIGRDCLERVAPECRADVRDRIRQQRDTGGASPLMDEEYLRLDGSRVPVEVTAVPIHFQGKEASLVFVRDITDRKRTQEALHQALTQLQRLNEELEQRVRERTAELLHRTRQLQKLTLEMSEAEDRERRRLAEILHDDLQQVLAAAKFHVGLMRSQAKWDSSLQATAAKIDQMLKDAIHKSRSLSHELSPAVLHFGDLGEIFRWLADQVQAKHGLVVHVHAHGEVHPQAHAVTALLYRTAQELLFNVVKHAHVDKAEVRVRQCGRGVCLSVSDRGRGFDPQELRAATGFGLLNIRERIELLGGRMKITSAIGKGSTFTVVVPDGEKPADRGQKTEEKLPCSALRRPSSVLRVLLADDHEVVRQGLALLLSEEHAVEIVGEATNGREAIDLADRLRPDVVVMDVSMPVMGGEEATRRIKEDLPQTRVIALSTYNEPGVIEKMYQAGAEGYVLKTASFDELIAAIRGRAYAAIP